MSTPDPVRFDDGAAYEHLMGRWSLLVADPFLDWLGLPAGAHWLDVGCGNGAFAQRVLERCAPASVLGVDPSPEQLAYARTRLPAGAPVQWLEAGAEQLPVADASLDAAVMALVLFFVPDPARGVAEMARAVRPGGTVAAYHWDIPGGGFPLAAIGRELKAHGRAATLPASVETSSLEASAALWREAGLDHVRTTGFTVQRTFQSFDDYWASALGSHTLRSGLAALAPAEHAALRERVRVKLGGGDGALTVSARANAVCGRRP